MKLLEFKLSTKLLGIALPLLTVMALFLLLTASALPQVGSLPDLFAYALELAPRSMYALAIGGSTALSMNLTGMNIANELRCRLVDRAAEGEFGPMMVLLGETFAWLAWAMFWGHVYLRGL